MNTSNYFSEVTDPRVTGRCLPLLSDILMIGLCTYLTGGTDYEDMRLFALERGEMLNDLLSLPNGVPSEIRLSVYSSVLNHQNWNIVFAVMVNHSCLIYQKSRLL